MPAADLPSTTQDYLKAIWSSLEWSDEAITSRELATRFGHSPSSVSETLKRLTAQGLVAHEPYGAIGLTAAGRRVAVSMVRRHRLIETFLVDYLGYAWDEVDDEAEVLEHGVSDRFIERLAERLGRPDFDPHGDPIPSADGTLPALPAVQLSTLQAPARVVVARVSDADPELLRYLTDHGITLGVPLAVQDRRDFAGTIGVELAGSRLDLGLRAAEAIYVTLAPQVSSPRS